MGSNYHFKNFGNEPPGEGGSGGGGKQPGNFDCRGSHLSIH